MLPDSTFLISKPFEPDELLGTIKKLLRDRES